MAVLGLEFCRSGSRIFQGVWDAEKGGVMPCFWWRGRGFGGGLDWEVG